MELKHMLREIVKNITNFPPKDEKEIYEFIEHEEWGVALETICSVIEQEDISIEKGVFKIIEEAGVFMEMDKTLWKEVGKQIN